MAKIKNLTRHPYLFIFRLQEAVDELQLREGDSTKAMLIHQKVLETLDLQYDAIRPEQSKMETFPWPSTPEPINMSNSEL